MSTQPIQLNEAQKLLVQQFVESATADLIVFTEVAAQGTSRKVWKSTTSLVRTLRRYSRPEQDAIMRAVETAMAERNSRFKYEMRTVEFRLGITVQKK